MNKYIEQIVNRLKDNNINENEYIQAVEEVITSIEPVIDEHPEYENLAILERITEPERLIIFKVPYINDAGKTIVHRGYRVQFSNLIGPYKGGLRFHPSVNQSVIKFLGFEQIFKNALTGLPIGGGKGGSDFDPKGKSDGEIMRFCQNFMTELYRHIGSDVDVPAGDIGVGEREIGYLFGQYKKIKNVYDGGVITGKGLSYGGSLCRKEATGYGLVYFTEEMLNANNLSLKGKNITISGSGNVAIYACEKAFEMGAKVIAMSDSNGCIYDSCGIDINIIKNIKEINKGRIKEYLNYRQNAEYIESINNSSPIWDIKTDIALPCATQNEVSLANAKTLVKNGMLAMAEGANMPCTKEASEYLISNNILYAPGKAANAGGVAVSAIEMSQNSMRYYFSSEEVDKLLKDIMKNIFVTCQTASQKYGLGNNYCAGANIASFTKLAQAMKAQGIV